MKLYKGAKKSAKAKTTDPFAIQEGKIKDGQIDSAYRFGWEEETYMPEAGRKEIIGRSFNFTKLPAVSAVILFVLMVLLTKVSWLQVVKNDYYRTMAEGNRVRIERVEPKRGIIYDRNLNTLVRNKANFLLYLVPADLPVVEDEQDRIIQEIIKIIPAVAELDVKEALAQVEALAQINDNSLELFRPLFIIDNIAYERAMALYLKSRQWPGVILTNKTRREYLMYAEVDQKEENKAYCQSMSHVLGYTGKISERELDQYGKEYLPIDYIGKMGIEYFWENELKGQSGKKSIEVDAIGKEKKILGRQEAIDGHNLVLSLDVRVQHKLEEILLAHLEKLNLNRAAAIIMDPRNGEMLALISLPFYNNNMFAQGISAAEYNDLINRPDNPLFNRCVSGEYPSGSTIKPVIAAAALEEGIITEHTIVNSVGGITIGQWFFPDWLSGGHGRTNVRRALAESVNTFFYYIGGGYENFKGLGVDRIVEYAKLFGLSAQTGIDLAGESSGLLPTRAWKEEVKGERWYIGDTYHLAIGQGDLLVTPLQVAAYTSVFANGGSLYRPHFIKAILSSDDKLIREVDTEPVRRNFIDPYNIEIVRQGLRQAVTSGSARRLQSVGVEMAGKTGTAQWSSKNKPHAWFTGFAPYDDPELVITILIEEGGEGSETAVPIAEEFLQWYFGLEENK